MFENIKVVKRDGKKVDFDGSKIALAIKKGFDSVALDEEEQKYSEKDVINYLKNNDCNVVQIDFNKIPLRTVNKEFLTHLKRNKQSDEHSIIYIDNFDKYTVPTDENFNIISKLKSYLPL